VGRGVHVDEDTIRGESLGTVRRDGVPAQHNRNQAAHFRDRSCEESLNGCETCIKRRTPALGVSCQWKQEKGEQ